jgi:ABC-type polysaccharide/polyol phosphate transport system ATPase subunit
MSYPAIVVDRLSKLYHRGQARVKGAGPRGFRGYLNFAKRLVSPPDGTAFRALDDVSFEVDRGEVFGIVGRNGAGKSTLLKILARITLPSSGRAEIYGRVSSLLEVGTGFHPELTGRENLYLSGSILGMRKSHIDRKFDEIVAFSGLENFLDTPVKHYSSGMFVRLAFSVAAHLEPDVLLADEVLAVGDANFWTKSINKMRALNAQGMTIVIVTHDMWLIQTVCRRAICIDAGRIVADGPPLNVISKYRTLNLGVGDEIEAEELRDTPARMSSLYTEERESSPDSSLTVFMRAEVRDLATVRFLVRLTSPDGLHYFTVYSDPVKCGPDGRIACSATIPRLMLMPGDYCLWGAVCMVDSEHILCSDRIPVLVRGNAHNLHKMNFLWNEVLWRIGSGEPAPVEEGTR